MYNNNYYEDGTLKWKANYRDGMLNGVAVFFSKRGMRKRIATYKEGKLVSRSVFRRRGFKYYI